MNSPPRPRFQRGLFVNRWYYITPNKIHINFVEPGVNYLISSILLPEIRFPFVSCLLNLIQNSSLGYLEKIWIDFQFPWKRKLECFSKLDLFAYSICGHAALTNQIILRHSNFISSITESIHAHLPSNPHRYSYYTSPYITTLANDGNDNCDFFLVES